MLTLQRAGQIANRHFPVTPMTSNSDEDNYLPQFGPGFYSTHYNSCDDVTVFIYERDGSIILDAEYRDSLWGDGGWDHDRTTCTTEEELVAAIKRLQHDISVILNP